MIKNLNNPNKRDTLDESNEIPVIISSDDTEDIPLSERQADQVAKTVLEDEPDEVIELRIKNELANIALDAARMEQHKIAGEYQQWRFERAQLLRQNPLDINKIDDLSRRIEAYEKAHKTVDETDAIPTV